MHIEKNRFSVEPKILIQQDVALPLGCLEQHTSGGLCQAYARIFGEHNDPSGFIENPHARVEVIDGVISVDKLDNLDLFDSVEHNLNKVESNIICLVAEAVNKFNGSSITNTENYDDPSYFEEIEAQYDAFDALLGVWDAIENSYVPHC